MSVVLGINAYHGDSAACVLVNGKLVAAAEEVVSQAVAAAAWRRH